MTATLTPARPEAGVPAEAAAVIRAPRGSAERAATLVLGAAIVFQPILHPSGPGNTSPVDVLTVGSIVTAALWLVGSHRKLRAPYFVPVALYVLVGAASGLASTIPGTSLQTLAIDLLLFVWCATVVNVVSAPRAMRVVLTAWSWSAVFWAAVVVVGWLGHVRLIEGLNPADGNRVMFTFGDPNYASMYWGSAIFIVFAARTPKARWARYAGYVLLLWALALTESNGGALALVTGITFLLVVRAYRRRGLIGAAATVLSVALVAGSFLTVLPIHEIRKWAANSNQPLLVNSIGRSGQSSSERSQLIQETLNLYEHSDGVVGLGPGGTKPVLTARQYPYANEAHDDYLAALVERGPFGLLAFVLLVVVAGMRASPLVRRRLSAAYASVVPMPAGLVAALLALGVNSFYEEVQHLRFVWALLAIVAVLGNDARRKQ